MKAASISRLVELRPGEGWTFLRAFLLLLLTIAAHTVLETARDALFLARLAPRNLAFVYMTTAALMVVVTPLNVRLTRAVGPKNALVVSLLVTAFSSVWFRTRPVEGASVFGLYVFGATSATVLIGQFWLLASGVFTAAQSRRLLGPLASAGVLGGIVGAGLASLLVRLAPVRSLLGVAALLYFAAAMVASRLVLDEPPPQSRALQSSPQASPPPEQPGLSRLRNDPFVLRLAVIAVLAATISVLVDYLFKSKVSASVAAPGLALFFARYQLLLGVASLVLQLAIAGRVVQRVGVVGLALTTPLVLVVGGGLTALLAAPFWLVVVLKSADNSLRNSLGRVAAELLWAPVENQAKARGLVDLVVTRGAQALAGGALLFASMGHALVPRHLAILTAALALGWLLVAAGVRGSYIALFRKALGRGAAEREFMLGELDLTSIETLVEALARPQPAEVVAAMNVLAERKRDRLIPALILLHDDEQVLLRALELLGPSPRKDWFALGERLLTHASPRVARAAVRAFALAGQVQILRRVQQQPSLELSTFASLYLAQLEGESLTGDPLDWQLFAADDEHHGLKRAFIEALATHPSPDATRILLRFGTIPALGAAVTAAFEQVGDESSVEFLIGRLKYADERLSARRGLVRLGDVALRALDAALWDERLERRVRIHVPRSISSFLNEEALRMLLRAMQQSKDGLVRYKALRGLEQLALETSLPIPPGPIFTEVERNALEYLRLFAARLALESDRPVAVRLEAQLVIELLDDKIAQSRDRLARLLQVLHRGDDIPAIFGALLSRDARRRGSAVEFLDALIHGLNHSSDRAPALLRLVVDDMPPTRRAEQAAALVGTFTDARSTLEKLSTDTDGVVASLALRAFSGLGPPRVTSSTPLSVLAERPA